MSKKQAAQILLLEEELRRSDREYSAVVRELVEARNAAYPQLKTTTTASTPGLVDQIKAWRDRYPTYSASASLDLWPLQDWLRLSFHPYTPGKAAQLNVGPLRLDFYQS